MLASQAIVLPAPAVLLGVCFLGVRAVPASSPHFSSFVPSFRSAAFFPPISLCSLPCVSFSPPLAARTCQFGPCSVSEGHPELCEYLPASRPLACTSSPPPSSFSLRPELRLLIPPIRTPGPRSRLWRTSLPLAASRGAARPLLFRPPCWYPLAGRFPSLGRKIAPAHGGFESRFKYLYVESTSITRTKLLNLRVNLRVDS